MVKGWRAKAMDIIHLKYFASSGAILKPSTSNDKFYDTSF
jgi:hypothetical protein